MEKHAKSFEIVYRRSVLLACLSI